MTENRHGVFIGLLWKEWREQRWRFFIGTVVLGGLLAGLLRAQVIAVNEAAILIYGPVGLLMVIFLAMGGVAGERADRTWEFLAAQPVSRVRLLRAKWFMGLAELIGMMAIATAAGMAALASRGFRKLPAFTSYNRAQFLPEILSGPHFLLALGVLALVATISLACWYTPLFSC